MRVSSFASFSVQPEAQLPARNDHPCRRALGCHLDGNPRDLARRQTQCVSRTGFGRAEICFFECQVDSELPLCVLKVSQSVSRVHVDALVASGVADLRWGSRGHKSLWRRERSSQKVSWAANVAVAAHEACARNDSGCKQVGFVLRNGRVPSLILIVRYFFGTILRSAARVHACMKLASERGVADDLECTVAHVHVEKWFLSQTNPSAARPLVWVGKQTSEMVAWLALPKCQTTCRNDVVPEILVIRGVSASTCWT